MFPGRLSPTRLDWRIDTPQQGVHYPQQGVQTLSGPPQGVHLVPGTSQLPVQFTTGVQQQQGGSFPGSVHLGQSPSMPFHPSQLFASGSQGSGQATLLPNAFNTTTLQEPAFGNWNMDTGASSHLNDSVHCLSDILNMCIYPSVAVGDGRFIPVTNSGHSVLSTPFRLLHLNNVLITPNIVKNLISVRQFVRDNSCTVEFDPFGFSVKDFITRRVARVPRCDSHGDSISCNKEKLPVLCHACQLGKHVKLSFVSSSSSVTSCFDIVHSDLWTSPIPSLSGFQYYVLFLDHYSQYVWVYPLMNKSDVLSKFLLFRNYVRTQFKCEIKSFQCDHGGEFDNHAFHKLFNDNGIQFRFSCPRTSQQNGKSERMIRTINNLIRTLLFQAHLPPNYWTEALNMAVYLLNILPSRAINNEIPFTRLFGAQPDYSVLRVFGCLCYPHIDTNHKLGPRATPSIFLGHAANHFGYRCLDLNTNKIIISRHYVSTISPLPRSYKEAFNDPNWRNAMFDEYNALIKNKTWTSVPRPEGANIVRCMWLFRHKFLVDGTLSRYKARLVANGSTQVEGVDVDETFSPVVKSGTIRTVLTETVYMHQPPGFRDPEHPDYVCLLQRSLYGLKQAPRAWFQRFAAYITTVGFTPSRCDSSLFIYRQGDDTAFLLLYVDDIVVAMEILERAHMVGCNSSRTPVDTESKLGDGGTPVVDPNLYQSLAGDFGLWFTAIFSTDSLIAYSDADWAGCPTTRQSTLGYCVFLGNNLLSWSSKLQPMLSHSSAEAEYHGVANAVAETC
ncbi:ribonuclease H-like domain-containing protein [Tanacetum coccineum]